MNILITGGGIANKGAQSMLYITVEQLRKKYPNDKIILLTTAVGDYDNLKLDVSVVNYYTLSALVNGMNEIKKLRRRVFPWKTKKIEGLFTDARLLIDISGYALGSNWHTHIVDLYLLYFECARKYNVPVYVMPQSFGPFNYGNNNAIVKRIKETMSYPQIIYAREKEGYDLMTGTMRLTNVRSSVDMVLLCKSASPANIYINYNARVLPDIKTNSVAVIPNVRNTDHMEKEIVLGYYKDVIRWLIEHEKNVYIIHHSKEDSSLCAELAGAFRINENMQYLDDEYDCFEYERIVAQFEFIVASRYHAIVHALKNNIPCIAIGWAIKYNELLKLCGLSEFSLNVREPLTKEIIEDTLTKMDLSKEQNKEKIAHAVSDLRKHNELFSLT